MNMPPPGEYSEERRATGLQNNSLPQPTARFFLPCLLLLTALQPKLLLSVSHPPRNLATATEQQIHN